MRGDVDRIERRRKMLDGVPHLLREDPDHEPQGVWLLAGSGPDGREEYQRALELASRPFIATANHGPGNVVRGLPDVYAVFEADAVKPCIKTIRMMLDVGVEVWGTQRVRKATQKEGVPVPTAKRIREILPQRAPTAGTALLWALCHYDQPEVIYVSGFRGYDDDSALNAEMSLVIDRVTASFLRTRFIFVGDCVMPGHELWQGERVRLCRT